MRSQRLRDIVHRPAFADAAQVKAQTGRQLHHHVGGICTHTLIAPIQRRGRGRRSGGWRRQLFKTAIIAGPAQRMQQRRVEQAVTATRGLEGGSQHGPQERRDGLRSAARGGVQAAQARIRPKAAQFSLDGGEALRRLLQPFRGLGGRLPQPDADLGVHGAQVDLMQHLHDRRVRVTGC